MGQITITNTQQQGAIFNLLTSQGVEFKFQCSTNTLTCDSKSDAELIYILTNELTPERTDILLINQRFGLIEQTKLGSDLTKAKLTARQRIQSAVANVRTIFMYGNEYTRDEPVGWGDKLSLAEKVVGSTATVEEIQIIQIEADARGLGETPEALATKQIEKANRLRKARSFLDGYTKRAYTTIENATEVATVEQAYEDFIVNVRTAVIDVETGAV